MELLKSLISEDTGFSLNDLSLLQRLALKKAFTGRLDPLNVSDKESAVLDSLVDLGLLDLGYDVTEDGARAAELLDQFARREREDLSVAKELAAADKYKSDDDDEYVDDEFPFTEMEKIAIKSAGLNETEIAKLFTRPKKIKESFTQKIDGGQFTLDKDGVVEGDYKLMDPSTEKHFHVYFLYDTNTNKFLELRGIDYKEQKREVMDDINEFLHHAKQRVSEAVKYNLTSEELSDLKKACKAMKLKFEAQAARPKVAKELIAKYKKDFVKEGWGDSYTITAIRNTPLSQLKEIEQLFGDYHKKNGNIRWIEDMYNEVRDEVHRREHGEPEDEYYDEPEDQFRDDVEADADALTSAGYGTDEDYGYFGGDEY